MWTNILTPRELHYYIPERRFALALDKQVLKPTHTAVLVSREEATPHTPNIYDQPRCVLPQLPPYLDSPDYSLKPDGTPGYGMVYDANLQQWQAPTPYELERALGL